jgi:predicted nucleic acid-binding protein
MYLLDTNIPLEILLEQNRSEEVEKFMTNTNEDLLYVSELSFYSIGIKLNLKNKEDIFLKFIDDLFIHGNVKLISLDPIDMQSVVQNIKSYNLDFDDAYQLTCVN